jgi:hypothetical protein
MPEDPNKEELVPDDHTEGPDDFIDGDISDVVPDSHREIVEEDDNDTP